MAKNYPKEAAIEKALVTHADLDGDDEGGNLVTDLLSGRKKMLEAITNKKKQVENLKEKTQMMVI